MRRASGRAAEQRGCVLNQACGLAAMPPLAGRLPQSGLPHAASTLARPALVLTATPPSTSRLPSSRMWNSEATSRPTFRTWQGQEG